MSTVYACPHCGTKSTSASKRCLACGQWVSSQASESVERGEYLDSPPKAPAEALTEIPRMEIDRLETGVAEFDRVTGGGLVRGATFYFVGDPGKGKTSLMLRAAADIATRYGPVLYVSAELSKPHLSAVAHRVGAVVEPLFVTDDNGLEETVYELKRIEKPVALFIDYLQKMKTSYIDNAPGSTPQLREVSNRLDEIAEEFNIPVAIVGETNQGDKIAGPKGLQYTFDALFRLDTDTLPGFVLLRTEKNRFGSQGEIGCFSMTHRGLVEVPDPSAEILKDRRGMGCLFVAMEGARPIATEVQALFHERADMSEAVVGYPIPRLRIIKGVLLRLGFRVPAGVVLDVLGGYKVTDPGGDLAVALAVASASTVTSLPKDLAAIGEVDLTGRILSPRSLAERVVELDHLGIKKILIPASGATETVPPTDAKVIRVSTVVEAIRHAGIQAPETTPTPVPVEVRRREGRRRSKSVALVRARGSKATGKESHDEEPASFSAAWKKRRAGVSLAKGKGRKK